MIAGTLGVRRGKRRAIVIVGATASFFGAADRPVEPLSFCLARIGATSLAVAPAIGGSRRRWPAPPCRWRHLGKLEGDRRNHLDGQTQDAIALSRMKVNRLLRMAQEQGLVEIRVHLNDALTAGLAENLPTDRCDQEGALTKRVESTAGFDAGSVRGDGNREPPPRAAEGHSQDPHARQGTQGSLALCRERSARNLGVSCRLCHDCTAGRPQAEWDGVLGQNAVTTGQDRF